MSAITRGYLRCPLVQNQHLKCNRCSRKCRTRTRGEQEIVRWQHLEVSINGGTPKSSISIGISIVNHPFWDTFQETSTWIVLRLCGPSHFVEQTGGFAWLKRTTSFGSFIASCGTGSGKSCPGYATLIGSF